MAWTPSHRPSQSSVSSLAHPLSPYLTLRLQSSFLYSGLADAFQYPRVLEALKSNPHIQASMVKCALLQCLVLGCVLGLDFLLLPAWTRGNTEGKLTMEPSTARFYYEVFWLYPLIGISFLLCGGFFSDVAARAGPSDIPSTKPRSSSSSSSPKSSFLARALVVGVYLVTCAALSSIPYLGKPLSFVYMSAVAAYYTFEYRFISFYGLHSLGERVRYLESRWPYFVGFGIPSTILSSWLTSSQTLNLAIWSLTFPLFLLMAAHSDPLPFDPLKPAKSHDLPGQEISKGTTKFASTHLNPEASLPNWWPKRIPVLYLAVLLDDLVSGFVGSFMRSSSSSGPKKSAEGYGSSNSGYPSAVSAGHPQNDAYAARRDAYSRSNQPGFGIGNPAPPPPLNASSGFARQADTYFGNLASGKHHAPSAPQPPRPDSYGVGVAGGVAVRREMNGTDSMQSRRRQGGST